MNDTQIKYLAALFDRGEGTCVSPDAYGTSVVDPFAEGALDGAQFVCVNPLLIDEDRRPTKDWHSPDRGRRADVNVTAYRNILLEIDKIPVALQQSYIDSLQLPYTTAVYSGGKSVHFVISLTEPVDIEKYKELGSKLRACMWVIDPTTLNPSRLTRLPGVTRKGTGKEQELLYRGARIELSALEQWLALVGGATGGSSRGKYDAEVSDEMRGNVRYLKRELKKFLYDGDIPRGCTSRHQAMMRLAGSLDYLKFDNDSMIALLHEAAVNCGLDRERDAAREIEHILNYIRPK